MRKCKRCDFTAPKEEFANAGIKNGKQYYRTVCKTCHNLEKTKRRSKTQKEFVEFKKGLTCSKCYMEDWRALEFHHINKNNKSSNISDMVSDGLGFSTILSEINKCEVLCANCHRIVEFEKRGVFK